MMASGGGTDDPYAQNTYWLVSLPLDAHTSKETAWSRLNDKTALEQDLSANYKFPLPDLRVGTLDSLLMLSDNLVKVTSSVEGTCSKLRKLLSELVKVDHVDNVYGSPVDAMLTRFSWDEAKYPIRRPLADTATKMQETVSKLDEDLKIRLSEYNALKSRAQASLRRKNGGLGVRDMEHVLAGKMQDVIDTEMLVTVFIVVPTHLKTEWRMRYETLASDVVPRSAVIVAQEDNAEMYGVVMFRRVADAFRTAAQQNGFTVRKFDKTEALQRVSQRSNASGGGIEADADAAALRSQERSLYEWCSAGFTECFSTWMHLYAIRVYVESILRYGLPPNFLTVVMKPNIASAAGRRAEAKARAALAESCAGTLDKSASKFWKVDADDASGKGAGLGGAGEGEHMYVSFSIAA